MGRKTTVLLVDDHPEFAMKIRDLLSPQFEVVGVSHDGNSALDAVRELLPDVVLLDIEMPGLSGIEVARLIRSSLLPSKIVFLTTYSDADYVRFALQAGAQGYVFKSSLNCDLIRALQEVIAGRTFVSRSQPDQEVPPV